MHVPRFQFRLSTLLLLVALLGAVFAWLGYNAAIVRERKSIEPLFTRDFSLRRVDLTNSPTTAAIPWIRRMLGDGAEHDLFYSRKEDPDGSQFAQVRRLFPKAKIWGAPWDESNLPEGVERFPQGGSFVISWLGDGPTGFVNDAPLPVPAPDDAHQQVRSAMKCPQCGDDGQ
jgi:hypothetical protein